MSEFDPNDWQGRRKDQVEYNETIGIAAGIAFIVILIGVIALKFLDKI